MGAVDGLDQFDHGASVAAGDHRFAVFEDGAEEVLNLEPVIMRRGVGRAEPGAVFGFETGQTVFLSRDGPEVVERRRADA